MKTAAEFELIALWMGWEKKRPYHGEPAYAWFGQNESRHGWVQDKISLTPAEAVEALERLKDQGWIATLQSRKDKGARLMIVGYTDRGLEVDFAATGFYPTIPAAVEMAIAKLVEMGGR